MVFMDYNEAFKTNLRALIESRGVLGKEVAEAINSTPISISRYLKGAREPELKYVVAIAKYFNVSVDWLLGLSDDKFNVLPPDIQELANLYSLAASSDRVAVQAILAKYREI